jgi:hypothetical protein
MHFQRVFGQAFGLEDTIAAVVFGLMMIAVAAPSSRAGGADGVAGPASRQSERNGLELAYLYVSARRKEPAPPDPWGGQTLEWATSSPPPRFNFNGQFPVPRVRSYAPLLDLREGRARSTARAGGENVDGRGPAGPAPDGTGAGDAGGPGDAGGAADAGGGAAARRKGGRAGGREEEPG